MQNSNITASQLLLSLLNNHQLLFVELILSIRRVRFGFLAALFFYPFGHPDILYNTLKQLSNAQPQSRRSLTKPHSVVIGLSLALFFADLSLLFICFVTHQNGNSVVVLKVGKQLHPKIYLLKTLLFRDIIDEHCAMSISEIVGHQTFELFLAGSVPQLQSVHRTFVVYVFHGKVNSHGLLN